jgi:hypothetical protein
MTRDKTKSTHALDLPDIFVRSVHKNTTSIFVCFGFFKFFVIKIKKGHICNVYLINTGWFSLTAGYSSGLDNTARTCSFEIEWRHIYLIELNWLWHSITLDWISFQMKSLLFLIISQHLERVNKKRGNRFVPARFICYNSVIVSVCVSGVHSFFFLFFPRSMTAPVVVRGIHN